LTERRVGDIPPILKQGRGVAQSGSVSEWGSEGRRFKSSRPDHENQGVTGHAVTPFIRINESRSTIGQLFDLPSPTKKGVTAPPPQNSPLSTRIDF
jgi:hypothetical protein